MARSPPWETYRAATSPATRATSFDGQTIVGFGYPDQHFEAARWAGGVPTGLGHPTGADSDAFDVSADGQVVVGFFQKPNAIGLPTEQAMHWEDGIATPLGFVEGTDDSLATGVSANGRVIVGRSWTKNDTKRVAFRWRNGQMQELPGLNVGGMSAAQGVSADGQVIVGYVTIGPLGDDVYQAFRWEDGVVHTLGTAANGGIFSFAAAASARGDVIVGTGEFQDGCCTRAYIWDELHGVRRIEDALVEDYGFSIPGWDLLEATDISLNGRTIVGHGINPNGDFEGWVITIPEPSAVSLVFVATATLAVLRRRYGVARIEARAKDAESTRRGGRLSGESVCFSRG